MFLYNAYHNSLLVFNRARNRLQHKNVSQISFEDASSLLTIVKLDFYVLLRTAAAEKAYIEVADESGAIGHQFANEPLVTKFSIIEFEANKIALSLNDRYLCADTNDTVTISRTSIREWETFEIVSNRSVFAKIDKKTSKPFPGRENGRFLRMAQVTRYGADGLFLRNARVISTDWIIVCSGGRLYAPHMAHAQRTHDNQCLSYPMIGGKSLKVAFLLGGYYNYYHHLIDYMVNFFAVGDWIGGSSIPILTLKATYKFQHEITAAFGIKEQIYEMDPLSNVKVKSLLVPPKAVVGDGVVRDKQILKHCTDYLTRKVGLPHQSALRLFISRERAGTRRAVNEASAIKVASSYGFIPINLEDLAFMEQVSLFMAAEAVAGLHGAGFANIIFSKPGCLVIEFLPTDKWKPQFFQNLSGGMGHRFIRIDAAGEFSSTTLEIDIDRFSEVLSKNFG